MMMQFGPLIGTTALWLFETSHRMDKLDPTALWGLVITTSLGFLGTAIQNYYANQKAIRDREWDLEDRRLKAQADADDRARIAMELEKKTHEMINVVRGENMGHVTKIRQAIQENTDISTQALREANNFTSRLEEVKKEIGGK